MKKLLRVALFLGLASLTPAALFAQAARDAVLQVTVLDETRGVLPGATVTVAGIESSNKAVVITPAPTSPQGLVKFESLAPGRYSITAEFSGFQTRTMPDVRIRSGENKQVVVLPIDRLMSSVTVERDRQIARFRSRRDLRHGHDPGADRGALGRSRRAPPAARGHRRARRQAPHRQLRGPRPAAEGADQIDPRHPRSVRAGGALRGRSPHRNPDPTRHRADAGEPAVGFLRQCDGRREPAW